MAEKNSEGAYDDAYHFLERVKAKYKDYPKKYEEFLQIMKNFKQQTLPAEVVLEQVSELFGHDETLLRGFQAFLPMHGISDATITQRPPVATMPPQPPMHFNGQMQMRASPAQVAMMGRPPVGGAPATVLPLVPGVPLPQRVVPPPFDDRTSAMPMASRIAVLPSAGGRGAAVRMPPPFPRGGVPMPRQPPPTQAAGGSLGFAFAKDYVSQVRTRFANDPRGYHRFLKILQVYAKAREEKSQERTDEALKEMTEFLSGAPELLEQFLKFVPGASVPTPPPMVGAPMDYMPCDERRPPSKRMRLNNGAPSGIILPDSHKNDELKRKFVERQRMTHAYAAATQPSESQSSPSPTTVSQPLELRPPSTQPPAASDKKTIGSALIAGLKAQIPVSLYTQILRILQLYPMGLVDFYGICELVCSTLKKAQFEHLVGEFRQNFMDAAPVFRKQPMCQSYYNYLTKTSELSTLPKVHTSYRRLPQDVVQPKCSGRTPLCRAVLNDSYISKPTGHEGPDSHSGGAAFRNAHKETLLQNEEDMYELDLMIETNRSTTRKLTRIVGNPDFGVLQLTAVDRRVVGRMYGDSAESVVKALEQTPGRALPVIIARLEQKTKEWLQLRRQMRPVWFMQTTTLYFQAYDYRYTLFKKAEEFRLKPKTLAAQITERHRRRKEDADFGFGPIVDAAHESPIRRRDVTRFVATMESVTELETQLDFDQSMVKLPDLSKLDELKKESLKVGSGSLSASTSVATTTAASSSTIVAANSSSSSIAGNGKAYDPSKRLATKESSTTAVVSSGMVDGVGVSHSTELLKEMIAPLVSERGALPRTQVAAIDTHDLRFYMDNRRTMREAASLFLNFAKSDIHYSGRDSFSAPFRVLFEHLFRVSEPDLMESFRRISASEERSKEQESSASAPPLYSASSSTLPLAVVLANGIGADEEKADGYNSSTTTPAMSSLVTGSGTNMRRMSAVRRRMSGDGKGEAVAGGSGAEGVGTGGVEPLALLMDDVNAAFPDDIAMFERKLAAIIAGKRLVEARCPLQCQRTADARSSIIWGNNHMYYALRYFQKLFARLEYARHIAQTDLSLRREQEEAEGVHKYDQFLLTVRAHLRDRQRDELFEDALRQLFGMQAYQMFSIFAICKQWYTSFTNVWDCVNLSTDFLILARFFGAKLDDAKTDEERSILLDAYWQIASDMSSKSGFSLYCFEFFTEHNILGVSLAEIEEKSVKPKKEEETDAKMEELCTKTQTSD